jgi:arylsulfatase A-like enzyme
MSVKTANRTNRPHILVILSDQLRRQALGCYGDPHGGTPHIDRLAADGVRFARACSTYPICVPFRFTFMTGHYAHSRDVPGIDWRMSPAERTLADEFNDAGYQTLYVGKWHLAGSHSHAPESRRYPFVPHELQGRWRKWLGFEYCNDHRDSVFFEDADPVARPLNCRQTDGLFDLAMNWLERERNPAAPFACVLSVEPPHPPYDAPPELERKWLTRDLALPRNFMAPGVYDPDVKAGWSAPRAAQQREEVLRRRKIYCAMVENLDQSIGRLMAWLARTGLAENTIVLFCSDHGELGGSHALEEKQYPYEESIGIPLLAWGPGAGVAAGRTVEDPVSTEDLFPTILGLAGLTPREKVFGANLAPLMRGAAAATLERPGVMLEFVAETRPDVVFYRKAYRGFRGRRFKYVALGNEAGLTPWHFYDLEKDPDELNNLVADPSSADEIRRHHGWLRERMRETGDHARLPPAFGLPGLNLPLFAEARR